MKKIDVDLPDSVVRVSEYVPEIIKYTEKIIQNKYAYEANGSVYFDVEAFSLNCNHCYAKLD